MKEELTEQDYKYIHHILQLRKMYCSDYVDEPPQFMNDEDYWREQMEIADTTKEKIQNILNTF